MLYPDAAFAYVQLLSRIGQCVTLNNLLPLPPVGYGAPVMFINAEFSSELSKPR